MNILRLKIGTNLVSVIKEQKYYSESERILLYYVQVISLLVHFQLNHYSQTRSSVPFANELMNSFTEK